MIQILTVVLLLVVGFFLVAYFMKEKGGSIKDLSVKLLALILTLATLYLFFRVLRFLI